MSVPDAIEFIVGNTYKQIPKHLAKTSRSTGALKEHDGKGPLSVKLYVKILASIISLSNTFY
jgi:hypothetical protein